MAGDSADQGMEERGRKGGLHRFKPARQGDARVDRNRCGTGGRQRHRAAKTREGKHSRQISNALKQNSVLSELSHRHLPNRMEIRDLLNVRG